VDPASPSSPPATVPQPPKEDKKEAPDPTAPPPGSPLETPVRASKVLQPVKAAKLKKVNILILVYI
tara:strand:- start:211 stop:408 length:198 start_codon:yes stop_codon:yes gene_type:complete